MQQWQKVWQKQCKGLQGCKDVSCGTMPRTSLDNHLQKSRQVTQECLEGQWCTWRKIYLFILLNLCLRLINKITLYSSLDSMSV